MKSRNGFTLIETVVCLAILGVITLGFMTAIVGTAKVSQNVHAYDHTNAARVSNLESEKIPADMLSEKTTAGIALGKMNGSGTSYQIDVNEYKLKEKDSSGVSYYYFRFGE